MTNIVKKMELRIKNEFGESIDDIDKKDFPISIRSISVLSDNGVNHATELLNKSPVDIIRMKGIGKKSYLEINSLMNRLGFYAKDQYSKYGQA